ncbi:MAG: outer membrane protein transport protein [Bacteroidota bacterium]
MTRTNRRGGTLLALTAAAIAMTSIEAQAGGFAIREQSAEGLGAAFAGIAAGTNDLSSMFWNPATLSLHDGSSVQGEIAAILPYANIDVDSSTRPTGVPGAFVNNGTEESGNLGSLAIVPSTYVAHQVNDKLRVGLAINSPFGLVNEANRGWAGNFHGLKSDLFSININPMASYDLSDYLSVGVGVQVQYVDVALTQENLVGLNTFAQGRATGDDWGYGVTAGVVFKPTEYTRVGLGYRSQIKHSIRGHSEVSTSGTGAPGTLTNLGKLTARTTLPEMVSLGVRHMVNEDWTVMGTVEWTNWSRFKELRIENDSGAPDNVTEEDWNDGWFFSVGAEHKWDEKLTLRGGVAYEISPVPDRTRTPRIPDNDRIWLNVGGSYQVSSNLSFSVAYSHIFVEDGPINLSRNDVGNAARGDLVGESKANVDIIAVSLKYDFGRLP